MKRKIVNVKINGVEAPLYEDSIDRLREDGFEIDSSESNQSDSDESILTTVKETVVEIFSEPEAFAYLLGAFAMLSSIVSVVVNYFFYGKLYERFHNKKK